MGLKRSRKRSYIKKKEIKNNESWGTNTKLYQSSSWRKKAKNYLQRNPSCKECERMGIERQADVVDHINPIPPLATVAQFWDMSKDENLQALCHRHHNSKTGHEVNNRKNEGTDTN